MLTRRRFLTISAAVALPFPAQAEGLYVTKGVALGAEVTLRLSHPEAPTIAKKAFAEIDRLENIFSLYRPTSALSQLNKAGTLDNPPFELLECLSLATAVFRASGGMFDPSVQPLWRAYAAAVERGAPLTADARAAALLHCGWSGVTVDPARIFLRRGMALTLNGIAQGYIADRVADLLAQDGLTDSLIDTGEMVALGGNPSGGPWRVSLAQGGSVDLHARALATSSPLGMTFGGDAQTSHILNPLDGLPAPAVWQAVSISAPSAALADALSTAACLMKTKDDINHLCGSFPAVRLDSALAL